MKAELETERYADQVERWPSEGRHILANFDGASIIVYQAYRAEIARYALERRALGGSEFSYARMSWIKPNFLWMMYRSGWGSKPNQQVTLALRISRIFFDELLAQAVLSSFDSTLHESRDAWQALFARASVCLQWDPDHNPKGAAQKRRVMQLGLRGQMLERFGKLELLDVYDLSDFVSAQCQFLAGDLANLRIPIERPYWPADESVATNVGLDACTRG